MSQLEEALAFQIKALGLPEPVREYRFAAPRRWRFDFSWPDIRLAVEVEGGQWVRGRHLRPKGFASDIAKYNAASAGGWRVLRFTGDMVKNGEAIFAIQDALEDNDEPA